MQLAVAGEIKVDCSDPVGATLAHGLDITDGLAIKFPELGLEKPKSVRGPAKASVTDEDQNWYEVKVRDEIEKIFLRVFARETQGQTPPTLLDESVLLETGLDSLGFAILVVELEEDLGFDPFTLSKEAYYPQTFGQFVGFYEANKP